MLEKNFLAKFLSEANDDDYASHRRLITLTICVCQFHELNDTEISSEEESNLVER